MRSASSVIELNRTRKYRIRMTYDYFVDDFSVYFYPDDYEYKFINNILDDKLYILRCRLPSYRHTVIVIKSYHIFNFFKYVCFIRNDLII